jgi:hypothetical protein
MMELRMDLDAMKIAQALRQDSLANALLLLAHVCMTVEMESEWKESNVMMETQSQMMGAQMIVLLLSLGSSVNLSLILNKKINPLLLSSL